jgi:hypothetical protein
MNDGFEWDVNGWLLKEPRHGGNLVELAVEILRAANDAAFRVTGEANCRSLAALGMTYSPTLKVG